MSLVAAQEGVPASAAPAPGDPDAGIALRLVQGDPDAVVELYDRYGAACYRLARRITANPALAEETVQDVFIALLKDTGFDARRGRLVTWLLSVTHHKAVDAVRREASRTRLRAAEDAADEVVSPDDPAETAWHGVRRDAVRTALAGLPDQQREVVVLAYFGGYTQQEIARLVDIPLGTVKSRTLAGMRALRDRLGHLAEVTGS